MGSIGRYRQLVAGLEEEARLAPQRYRTRLAVLALLGFVVLGAAILLALGASVGLVAVLLAISPLLLVKFLKVIWIPLYFAWAVLRALWIRFEPPDGHRLAPGEAPALQAEIERLRKAADAPPLEALYIDAQLNAAAVTVPRLLGLLGHRYYMVLGLPLMERLDRDQFAAVVAHEFGHFGGKHGHFAGWIYRLRSTWYALLGALKERDTWAARPFARFFDWYASYFDACSFVLARHQEFEADAMAARIAGPRAMGQALGRIHTGSERLDQEFWPAIERRMRTEAEPPEHLLRDMTDLLRRQDADEPARLARALASDTEPGDSHPAFARRLAQLGIEAEGSGTLSESAATALLGDLVPTLEAELGQRWSDGVAEHWRSVFRQHEDDQARIVELEAMHVKAPAELAEYARLVDDLRTPEEAIPLFQATLAVLPDDVNSHFRLGARLLDRDDAEGVDHLRRVMALEPQSASVMAALIDAYYRRIRVDDEARDALEAERRAQEQHAIRDHRSRNALSLGDRFLPHELEEGQLQAIRAALDSLGTLKKAWIARKQLPGTAAAPHYVVLVECRFLRSESTQIERAVAVLSMPGSFIVTTAGNQRLVARKIRKAAGEPVYHRR